MTATPSAPEPQIERHSRCSAAVYCPHCPWSCTVSSTDTVSKRHLLARWAEHAAAKHPAPGAG